MPPSVLNTLALLPAMITQLGANAAADKSSSAQATTTTPGQAGGGVQLTEHQHITQQGK